MKVMVVGSGGREHALVWKLSQSPRVDKLYCAPGNPGTALLAESVAAGDEGVTAIADFAENHGIDLTIVGPEAYLASGLVDEFQRRGLRAFGPTKAAAEIEASKVFAKRLMDEYGIPTARYRSFTDPEAALAYVEHEGAPIVIKANGLAAGKGVTVARTVDEAIAAVKMMMMDRAFGQAGSEVVVEEYLEGEEASILAFCDGTSVIPMESAQDHKAVRDGDQGPNTGGMGAYSPAPIVDERMRERIVSEILKPAVLAMAQEGRPYVGVLYAGLMIGSDGPKVIEFNCRMGDPEAQVVLARLQTDLVDVCEACLDGTLDRMELRWDERPALCVVMASKGYPGPYERGQVITGIDEAEAQEGVLVFHAGTCESEGRLLTSGGRVLSVTALGSDIRDAARRAYAGVRRIHFSGAHYRTDIGHRAIDRL